jgi:DMSO/TMAO reductase YedYZ molybdopterin-dependent catalytic subunit
MSRNKEIISGVDAKLFIKDAARFLPDPARRAFLRGGASLGAVAFLSGCDITNGTTAEKALSAMSRFNDRVQAIIFGLNRLAPTYPENAITKPFPFNADYSEDQAPDVDGTSYKLKVGGLVQEKKSWTLPELYALPQESQITRHICVEGWSAIGKWSGARLSDFLQRISADTAAKYIKFICAEGYSTSIDMATALHPQTQMTFKFADQTLPRSYGYPMKVRIPTKLGFKNPKHVVEMYVTNDYPGGYWEDQGYNWFSGL